MAARILPAIRGWPAAKLAQRPVAAEEVPACAVLEAASYPADEAASPESLAHRQQNAGGYFLATFEDSGELVGFVCGTRAKGPALTHESMEQHVPDGDLLCVHSVVVREDLRRKGIAVEMLRGYIRAVAGETNGTGTAPTSCALIAKAGLVALYQKAGFELIGLSPVVHGKDPWFELRTSNLALSAKAEPILQCDAFATLPCTGNPAAVVFTQRGGDAQWMQNVALENNLSETAFVERLHSNHGKRCLDGTPSVASDAQTLFALRWFTPTCEVDLCGHATLGAAHALWATRRASKDQAITFVSKASGELTCRLTSDGWVELDFPVDPPALEQTQLISSLAKALCVNEAEIIMVGKGRFDIIVEITPMAFDGLTPNQTALAEVDCRGVIATAAGSGKDEERIAAVAGDAMVDFRSRFFAPRVGVPEDPVCGSAHCTLAPYWAAKLGRDDVLAFQASARGGLVRCRLLGDRVVLSGRAVTTMEGTLHCG